MTSESRDEFMARQIAADWDKMSDEERKHAVFELEAARRGNVLHRCIKCSEWMEVRFEDFATLGREVAGICQLCKSSEKEEQAA